MSGFGKLSQRKLKAVAELVQGETVQAAAEAAGVTARTVQRWKNEPGFKAELEGRRRETLRQAKDRLYNLAGDAVKAFEEILENPGTRGASVKRLTAKDILEMLLKWVEVVELEERVTRLEGQVNHERR